MLRITFKLLLSLWFLLEAGCTNRGGLSPLSSSAPSTSSTSTTVSPDKIGSSSGLVLNQALPNLQNPNTVLDLFGDGSLGNYCVSSTSSAGGNPSSTCACTYSYTYTNGQTTQLDVPVLYQESNLLRCDYSSIPSEIEMIQVSIHLKTADIYSNAVAFNTKTLNVGLDTTNIKNFSKVYRYQCRDIVTIPYLLGGNLPDPILSEDPHLSYPLNFYAVNLANALAQFTMSGQERWQCPSIPAPSEVLTDSSFLSSFYTKNNINLTVYSARPLSKNNDYLIYPHQSGSPDRSTFYLLNTASGIFNVPVNAFFAPNLSTSMGSTTSPPLGYAASPTLSEACPHTPLPAGYQWVKVWLFRASLTPRKYPTSANLSNAGPILCHPGTWLDANGNTVPVFPSCDGSSISIAQGSSTNFADRIIGTQQCLGLSSANAGAFSDQGDIWTKRSPASHSNDPCKSNYGLNNLINTCISPHPFATDISYSPLDTVSRYDFLFVVSPPSVTREDIFGYGSQGASQQGKSYTPVRFMTFSDCPSTNPTSCCGSADLSSCSSPYFINTYAPKSTDVSVTSDLGGNANNPSLFPLCAIQPIPSP